MLKKMEISEADIRKIADSVRVLQRGKSYFRAGRVKSLKMSDDFVVAKIRGSHGNYTTKVWVEKDKIAGSCTCPYGSGCKHQVALLCAIEYQNNSLEKKLRNSSSENPAKTKWNISLQDIAGGMTANHIIEAISLWELEAVKITGQRSDRVVAIVTTPLSKYRVLIQRSFSYFQGKFVSNCECTSYWGEKCSHFAAVLLSLVSSEDHQRALRYKEDLLHTYREERFQSLVNLLAGSHEHPEKDRRYQLSFVFDKADGLTISVSKQTLRKNGTLGKATPASKHIMSKHSQGPQTKSRALQLFLTLLEADYSNSITLKKENFDSCIGYELLRLLQQLYLEEPSSVVGCTFPDEKGKVEISFEENGVYHNMQFYVSFGDQAYLLDPRNTFILCQDPLWLYHYSHSTIIFEANTSQPQLLARLLCYGKIEIDQSRFHEFLEQYYRPLSRLGQLALPQRYALQQKENIPPIPRVYLQDHGSSFSLTLRYLYESEEVADNQQSQLIFKDKDNIVQVRRDTEKEKEFRELLLKTNAEEKGGIILPQNPSEWLVDTAKELINSGFEIYGQYELTKHRIIEDEPQLEIAVRSGIDWFDLQLDVTVGEEKIAFSKIMHNLRNNERFIKLSDGKIGVIPQKWLRKLSGVIGLLEKNEKKQQLKAVSSQINIIESLLEIADKTSLDSKTKKFREKFSSFKGIQETQLPQQLQGTLRPYQKAGYDWLHFLRDFSFGGCLADEMGLGKTVQVLSLLLSEQEKGNSTPSLIIVPTSLVFNWQEEVKKFTPTLQVYVHHGMDRLKNFDDIIGLKPNLILTTYGTIKNDVELFRGYRFHYIILDESQQIKNPLTKTTRAVYSLQAAHRLVMTGTPIENTSLELWSQFAFLNPGLLGKLDYFKQTFATKIEQQKDTHKASALKNLVNPFLLLRKKEVVAADLPEKQITTLYCEMDQKQREFYESWKEKLRQEISASVAEHGLQQSRMKILKGLTILRQICNHPQLINEGYTGKSAKFSLLTEQIQSVLQEGHKVLIFSSFVKMLQLFKRHFEQNSIAFCYLDGRTKNRQQAVEDFQNNEEIKIFLISLRAGGTGLNLTAADYVFLVDPWWNPAVEMQAIDRAHRIGQDKKVFVYKAIAKDSVEEKILQLQEEKLDLVKNVITVEEGIFKKLALEDIKKVFG